MNHPSRTHSIEPEGPGAAASGPDASQGQARTPFWKAPGRRIGRARRSSPPSRPRRLARTAAEVAIFAALLLGVRAYTHRGVVQGPAPALEATRTDGMPASLAALRGRPVLVHFWASWCGVCKVMQGSVEALARDHAVITVASQSGTAEEVVRYLNARGLEFPVVADPEGALARAWGVSAFPASFILAPDGSVKFVEVGYTTGLGLRVRLWLAEKGVSSL